MPKRTIPRESHTLFRLPTVKIAVLRAYACDDVADYLLEIVEGPEAGRQIELGDKPVEIGREEGVDVVLAGDSLVSRRHARLTPTANGIVVDDLDSSNGTFVNGDQIYSSAVLVPGNELTVGVSVLELRTSARAAATSVRPVPAGLTSLRASPPVLLEAAPPPGSLAVPERRPDYVPPELLRAGGADSPLSPLLDVHTKRMAKTAPLALFILVVFVVIIALALR